MYQNSTFGTQYSICFGKITAFSGTRGTVSCRFGDGSMQQATLLREYVFPPLPPSINLCVGLEVRYEHHFPSIGGEPYAYNVHVLSPLPWGVNQQDCKARDPPRKAAPYSVVNASLPAPRSLESLPPLPDSPTAKKTGDVPDVTEKGSTKTAKKKSAAAIAAADLEAALQKMSLKRRVVSNASMRLFCGHCGKEQAWDMKSERNKPVKDPNAPDGLKRTGDGGRVIYDAQDSACGHCGAMIMCNPLSAVCNYCDTILTGFRPTYWKCMNKDGTNLRRAMPRAPSAKSSPSNASWHETKALKQPRADATSSCSYSQTCDQCVDYDLRYRYKPPCNCPRFHGAIAGQVTGNKTGNVGWAMVH